MTFAIFFCIDFFLKALGLAPGLPVPLEAEAELVGGRGGSGRLLLGTQFTSLLHLSYVIYLLYYTSTVSAFGGGGVCNLLTFTTTKVQMCSY